MWSKALFTSINNTATSFLSAHFCYISYTNNAIVSIASLFFGLSFGLDIALKIFLTVKLIVLL